MSEAAAAKQILYILIITLNHKTKYKNQPNQFVCVYETNTFLFILILILLSFNEEGNYTVIAKN